MPSVAVGKIYASQPIRDAFLYAVEKFGAARDLRRAFGPSFLEKLEDPDLHQRVVRMSYEDRASWIIHEMRDHEDLLPSAYRDVLGLPEDSSYADAARHFEALL